MPRRGSNGRYIFSAGEISQYTVCPESWRLQQLRSSKARAASERSSLGRELHSDWASKLDESAFLFKGIRVIFALVAIAIGIFIITAIF